jgi:hypothetical protein
MMGLDKFHTVSGLLVISITLEHKLSESLIDVILELFQPYLYLTLRCNVAFVQFECFPL